jgi:transcriptional regulator with XRE-family HTH domain
MKFSLLLLHAKQFDIISTMVENMSTMKDESTTKEKPIALGGQEINLRIAGRVRALRMEQGLTLDALAAKSDVSRSMLSLVERGESSPTAVVLDKIATGLGVSLASLFDDDNAPPDPISRQTDRIPWRDPASGYVRRNISPANFPSPIHLVEVELPAGASVAYETGTRDVSIHQQVWVQAGCIELSLGDITYHLAVGDCLAMQLDAPTTFRNRTDQPARYLVVIVTEHLRAGRR